jgi:phage tail-like protein
MSRPVKLNDRLPRIWRRLDSNAQLEHFLNVLDNGLDKSHDLITGLLELHTVDRCPDKFLPFLGTLVGHVWRDDQSYSFNRERIRDAIHRHSYKGTNDRLSDTVEEHGGQSCNVTDMASKLLVLSRQGRLSCSDAYMVNYEPYHDGSFYLTSDKYLDFQEFLRDFSETAPAAEKWFFVISSPISNISYSDASPERTTIHSIRDRSGLLGYGRLSNELFLSWDSNLNPAISIVHSKYSTSGDHLTIDSNLNMNHTDVPFTSPVGVEAALVQEKPQKTSILL